MAVPQAKDMAAAISSIFTKLDRAGLLQNYYASIMPAVSDLKSVGTGTSWSINIGQGEPVLFKDALDIDNKPIVPRIMVDIIVDGSKPFPYSKWDIALEIWYKDNIPLTKWHFDLANPAQSGPRIHMQCGGHFKDQRSYDLPLKIPRWHHPAFDLILLTEIVIANFYEQEWKQIREDRSWCNYIHQSQKLCMEPYIEKLSAAMGRSNCTILSEMWSDKWI